MGSYFETVSIPHSSLTSLFLYSHGLMDSYVSKLHSIPFIIYLEAPIIPNLTSESPFDLCPCYVAVSYCEHILTFWHDKMPQAHPSDSLSQLWSQPFSRRSLDLFSCKMVFGIQDLGTRRAHSY